MVYSYFTKLDKQVNETLILYKNLAKLTQPMIKYLIFILSFLIFTSCFILLYYCFIHTDSNQSTGINNNTNDSNNNLFTNVILPIILYGLLCPILSSILSSICKLFFDNIVQKIKTKHLCFKHIIKHNNIYNYLFFHKLNIIYPLFFIFIYHLNNYIKFIYILTYFCIQFNRIFIFYTNSIDCKIISIEKCYNNSDNFWNFELEINTNSEKKTVFKRFNDFKKLSNNTLYNNIKLPTSSWLFKPTNINDVTHRAVELNKYISQITTHDSLLQDSVFFNFINDTKEETNNIVLEKEFIHNSDNDNDNNNNEQINYNNIYSNINNIKKQCKLLLQQHIQNIFILNEINYFNTLKKRIFIITQDTIYKIKYYITQNIFEIRLSISLSNIKYAEYSRINNTITLCDESILIIYYNNNDNIKITSLNQSYYYNINSIVELLKSSNIQITYIDSIDLDNGFGITENVFNSSLFNSIKDTYYNSYLYLTK